MEFTIEKTQVECYKLRNKQGYFADITLDSGENSGRISISSDFGTWAYYWGACGCSFKNFITGLDIDYAADKFNQGRWFDAEKTIQYLRKRIKEYCSDKECKKNLKIEIASLIGCDDRADFDHAIQQCAGLMEMEDNMPELMTSINPGFRKFWEITWQAFIVELKKEEKA